MSDKLEKLLVDLAANSENQVVLLREGLKSSQEFVISAQRLVDGIRKIRGIPDGIQEGLKTLFAKLDEDEKQYTEIFRLVARAYGDDPADNGDEDEARKAVTHDIGPLEAASPSVL